MPSSVSSRVSSPASSAVEGTDNARVTGSHFPVQAKTVSVLVVDASKML